MMMGRQIGYQTNEVAMDEGHRVTVQVTSARSHSTVELEFCVWDTVKHVKRGCERATSIPVRAQQLLFLGRELSNRTTLQALLDSQISCAPKRLNSLEASKVQCVLEIVLRILPNQVSQFGALLPLSRPKSGAAKKMVERIVSGFNRKLNPKPTPEGLSGSYFLRDRFRNSVAIFKPRLEEPFAPQNPKGLTGKLETSIHASNILSGRLYLREAAAFLLDENKLFGVSETFLAVVDHPFFTENQTSPISIPGFATKDNSTKIPQPKIEFHKTNVTLKSDKSRIGSLQKMMPNNGCISNISISKISNFEVQKIAILDMRILNADRNDGNILFRRRSSKPIELIPIDHGMSLGSKLALKASEMVWTGFPQIKKEIDPRLKKFVLNLNPERTIKKLSENLDLKAESLAMLQYSEYFLKICVEKGLKIDEMAQIFYRQGDEESPSHLEKLIESVEFLSKKISKAKSIDWYTENKIFDRSARLSGQSLDLLISKMKESPSQLENLHRKNTDSTLPEPKMREISNKPISNIPNLYEIGLNKDDMRKSIELCPDFFSPRTFLSKGSPIPNKNKEVLEFSLDTSIQKSRISQSTKNEDPILILDGTPNPSTSNPFRPNSNVQFPLFTHFEKESSEQINEFEKAAKLNSNIPQICQAFVDSGDLRSHCLNAPKRARRRLFSEQKPQTPRAKQRIAAHPNINKSLHKSKFFSPNTPSDPNKEIGKFDFDIRPFEHTSSSGSTNPQENPEPEPNLNDQNKKTKTNTKKFFAKEKIKLPFRSAQKEEPHKRRGLKRSLSMCELFEELNDFRESSKPSARIPSAEEFGEVRCQVKTRETRDLELLQKNQLKMHFFCSSLEQFLDAWVKKRPLARAKRKYTAPVSIGSL